MPSGLLARSPDYYDAYIATGMGKYIIGGKAAPVRWVLRLGGFKGDQEQGVKELALVADHGRFLSPFARILLAFDDLRHKNRTEARKKLEWLREHFPNNPLFSQEIAKLDHPSPGRDSTRQAVFGHFPFIIKDTRLETCQKILFAAGRTFFVQLRGHTLSYIGKPDPTC